MKKMHELNSKLAPEIGLVNKPQHRTYIEVKITLS
jgi:hypothetical protein